MLLRHFVHAGRCLCIKILLLRHTAHPPSAAAGAGTHKVHTRIRLQRSYPHVCTRLLLLQVHTPASLTKKLIGHYTGPIVAGVNGLLLSLDMLGNPSQSMPQLEAAFIVFFLCYPTSTCCYPTSTCCSYFMCYPTSTCCACAQHCTYCTLLYATLLPLPAPAPRCACILSLPLRESTCRTRLLVFSHFHYGKVLTVLALLSRSGRRVHRRDAAALLGDSGRP